MPTTAERKGYLVFAPEIPVYAPKRNLDSPARIEVIQRALEEKTHFNFSYAGRTESQEAANLAKIIHSAEMMTLLKRYNRITQDHLALFDDRLLPLPEIEAYETPLYHHVYTEALLSAASAIKAANLLINNYEALFAFSLARPPGHHAGKDKIGGFCYLNNVALAVEKLSQRKRKVAILDIDLHHGNGTQEIFWDRDILFVSLHGDPKRIYPRSGFPEEQGRAEGEGQTYNLPFRLGIKPENYLELLQKGVSKIDRYNPDILVVSAGFDTHELDRVYDERAEKNVAPTRLREEDYGYIGEAVGNLKKQTVLVLEGGYNLEVLGNSVANFIDGLHLALTHR